MESLRRVPSLREMEPGVEVEKRLGDPAEGQDSASIALSSRRETAPVAAANAKKSSLKTIADALAASTPVVDANRLIEILIDERKGGSSGATENLQKSPVASGETKSVLAARQPGLEEHESSPDLLNLVLNPKSTLPLLTYLATHDSPTPTRTMRDLRIGKSSWYGGLERLRQLEVIGSGSTVGRPSKSCPVLNERGARLHRAVDGLRSALDGTEVSLRFDLRRALTARRFDEASGPAVLLARALLRRGQHREIEGIISILPARGFEFEISFLRAQLLFAEGRLPPEDPILGPYSNQRQADNRSTPHVCHRLFVARVKESRQELAASFAEVLSLADSKNPFPNTNLEGDLRLSMARLKMKSGNIRDALQDGWKAIEIFDSVGDWPGWAEAQNLELSCWMMNDFEMAAAFRDLYGPKIERLPPSPMVTEHLALASILEAARGHYRIGRDLLRASKQRESGAIDWCSRTRLTALWGVADECLAARTIWTPEQFRVLLLKNVASTP